MTITLITATYNSAATLRDTLASVRSQTYGAIEHWVIDGGSTDETLAIVADYPEVNWLSEPDRGLYDAMNKGIARATGEVVGIINSDDFYAHPQVLERVMAVFTDPEVEAVYGDLNYIHPEQTERLIRQWRSATYDAQRWRWGWMPPHPTFFVRRSLYERYGVFNLDFHLAADYELMLRFCYKHGVEPVYLPEVLVKMRIGGVSNASLRHRWRANREDQRAWTVNQLRPFWWTTLLKPLRKVGQFIKR